MNTRRLGVSAFALLCATAPRLEPAYADDVAHDDAVVRALPLSKHSLQDAVRLASKDAAAAISARFEDEGHGLRLSVRVAKRGLGVDAESNVFEETAGDPAAPEWKPSTTTFEDVVHVARASEQLTLMRTTRLSLADTIASIDAQLRPFHDATVFSVAPAVREGRRVFVVAVAVANEAFHFMLDLDTRAPVGSWPRMPKRPLPTPLLGKVLPEPVVGKGTWIGPTPPSLAETVGKRVVLVVSNSYG